VSFKNIQNARHDAELSVSSLNYRNALNFHYFLCRSLAIATNDGNHGQGIFLDGAANHLAGFSIALRGYGAGIYNVRVALFGKIT
jgi:hypothetical protein